MAKRQQSTQKLALDGELTIYRAEALKAELLAAAHAKGDVELDLSAVIEIDTTGVQLLLAFAKSLAARGVPLRFTHASAPVREAFGLLGIEGRLAA